MRLGVLDLGSNSFHLAVYRSKGPGSVDKIVGAKEMCRIGAGIVDDGMIDDTALRLGARAVERLLEEADRNAVDKLAVVATSAIRDASNGPKFCDRVRRRHGISVEILSGHEEAHLVFQGARHGLERPRARIAVIDVGGGSGQIVAGDGDSVTFAASLPIGVLRMRPLGEKGLGHLRDHVRGLASPSMRAVRRHAPQQVVLASGTARRLGAAARILGLASAESQQLSRVALRELAAILPSLSTFELDSLGIEAARRDTIAPGAAVLETLLEMCGASTAIVSRSGLREGVALREAVRHARAFRKHQRRHAGVAAWV